MGNLGSHGADHCEALRLEVSLFQPLAFFHLGPQIGSSALDRLFKIVVRAAKRRQQPDDDEKEHKKHDGVPNRNQRMLICRPTEHVAEEPDAGTERSQRESRPAARPSIPRGTWAASKKPILPTRVL